VLVARLGRVAKRKDATPAQIDLAWSLAQAMDRAHHERRSAIVRTMSSGKSVSNSSSSGPSGRQPGDRGMAISTSPARLTRS